MKMQRKAAGHSLAAVRCLAAILTVLTVLAGFIGSPRAWAQEYIPDTTPVSVSGDYSYKVYEGGEVEIVEYNGQERNIVIPTELDGNTVTLIGDEAFSYYEMESLTIPAGIRVNGRAFQYCEIEKLLSLPVGIQIGIRAFEYASLPDTVLIPEEAVISGSSFSYCEDLELLFLSPSASITDSAFSYSEDLKQLILAEGSSVTEKAFYSSYRLSSIILCGNVELGENAFPYCTKARTRAADAGLFDRELENITWAPRTGGSGQVGTSGQTTPGGQTGSGGQNGTGGQTTGKRIGEDAAMTIALDDAGRKPSQVDDADVKLKQKTGSEYYKVEFEAEGYEYEYRIEAFTGEILYASRER